MIKVEENKGVAVVSLNDSDRLNAAIAEEVKLELSNVINNNNGNVLMNLSNIKFIDSSGIGVLISALKTARQNNRGFYLCCLQKDVLNLLKLMKLDKVFDIYDSKDAIS
ncbi:STAS domain-containing protein [Plebeiibacterium marinum]|uniref:Anti-sigma factor antagonist n=1 Tax=Plebeiibacterium marinum TaxID=2992111 RepID=A0AAE3MBX6_9BACT|nr:STAS domain-containing protein [Plebeiobacterium marinum]MCW3804885.1 STAS domain-containing protein [Plebeiobacterium marinum]